MTKQYTSGTKGHIRQALVDIGILPEVVKGFAISKEQIWEDEKLIALYRYFPCYEKPLFYFKSNSYSNHRLVELENNRYRLILNLGLSQNMTPVFEIRGQNATQELYEFIRDTINNHDTISGFVLSQKSKAQLTPVNCSKKNITITVTFGNVTYAKDWVDFISYRFKPKPVIDLSKEVREYPAYWFKDKIHYAKDEEVYEYQWDHTTESRIQGIAFVIKTTEGERVQSFSPFTGGKIDIHHDPEYLRRNSTIGAYAPRSKLY